MDIYVSKLKKTSDKIWNTKKYNVRYDNKSWDEYSKVIFIVWLIFIEFKEFFVLLVFHENVAICSNNVYNIYNIPNETYGEHSIGNIIPVYQLKGKQAHSGNIAEK